MWKTPPKQIAKCPVCRTVLGTLEPKELSAMPCDECDVVFYFSPGSEKPKNSLMAECKLRKKGTCGCGGCGR